MMKPKNNQGKCIFEYSSVSVYNRWYPLYGIKQIVEYTEFKVFEFQIPRKS